MKIDEHSQVLQASREVSNSAKSVRIFFFFYRVTDIRFVLENK